jgi:hypothetical protein
MRVIQVTSDGKSTGGVRPDVASARLSELPAAVARLSG